MPVREQRRPPASSPIIVHESSESSVSLRDLSLLVSGSDPKVTVPARPTTILNISDAALSSPDDSMYRFAGDKEQLECPSRPMTLGEEEITRI